MDAAIRSFINDLRTTRRMSNHTVRAYASDLSEYAEFSAIRGVGISTATPDHCGSFLDRLEADGRSSATRKRRLSTLRNFHAFALRRGMCDHNPAAGVAAPKRRVFLPTVLTEDEIARLIAASSPRDAAMIELAYSAGLRVSELVGLNVADLRMESCEAVIMGKGGSQALVVFGRQAAQAIDRYLAGRTEGPLFLAITGLRLSPRTFRQRLAATALRAGIDRRVHPHALRHSCATHMHERGADILTLKEVLRHKSLSTTLVYTHFDRTRIREAQRRFHPRG